MNIKTTLLAAAVGGILMGCHEEGQPKCVEGAAGAAAGGAGIGVGVGVGVSGGVGVEAGKHGCKG